MWNADHVISTGTTTAQAAAHTPDLMSKHVVATDKCRPEGTSHVSQPMAHAKHCCPLPNAASALHQHMHSGTPTRPTQPNQHCTTSICTLSPVQASKCNVPCSDLSSHGSAHNTVLSCTAHDSHTGEDAPLNRRSSPQPSTKPCNQPMHTSFAPSACLAGHSAAPTAPSHTPVTKQQT